MVELNKNDPKGLLNIPLPLSPLSTNQDYLPYSEIDIAGPPPAKRHIHPDIINTWTRILADSPDGTSFVKATVDNGLSVSPNAATGLVCYEIEPQILPSNTSVSISLTGLVITRIYGLHLSFWLSTAAVTGVDVLFTISDNTLNTKYITRDFTTLTTKNDLTYTASVIDNFMSSVAISVPIAKGQSPLKFTASTSQVITNGRFEADIYYE